jgi:hypothetical protein
VSGGGLSAPIPDPGQGVAFATKALMITISSQHHSAVMAAATVLVTSMIYG